MFVATATTTTTTKQALHHHAGCQFVYASGDSVRLSQTSTHTHTLVETFLSPFRVSTLVPQRCKACTVQSRQSPLQKCKFEYCMLLVCVYCQWTNIHECMNERTKKKKGNTRATPGFLQLSWVSFLNLCATSPYPIRPALQPKGVTRLRPNKGMPTSPKKFIKCPVAPAIES